MRRGFVRDELQYSVRWDKQTGREVDIGRFPPLTLDVPVEFGGGGRYPCPDELFLSAVAACLLATFLYFKKAMKFHLEELRVSAKQTIDRSAEKGRGIAAAHFLVDRRVDALIAEGLGEGPFHVLRDNLVKIYKLPGRIDVATAARLLSQQQHEKITSPTERQDK